MYYYLNDDHTYVPCSLDQYGNQIRNMCKTNTKHVADEYIGDKRVSTVWLGIDHNFYANTIRPLLFETMIFENEEYGDEIYMRRYTTWEDAVEGHKEAVEWVKNGCIND